MAVRGATGLLSRVIPALFFVLFSRYFALNYDPLALFAALAFRPLESVHEQYPG